MPPGMKRQGTVKIDDSFVLQKAAVLHASAAAKLAEAESLTSETASFNEKKSLALKLGIALANETKSVPDLIREWDSNKDGEINKVELRQVVRNKLKIQAENKEIDALFDKLDDDKGGSLDLKEIQKAMGVFKKQWRSFQEMQEQKAQRAEEIRGEAKVVQAAAEATQTLEEHQAKQAGLSGESVDGAEVVRATRPLPLCRFGLFHVISSS